MKLSFAMLFCCTLSALFADAADAVQSEANSTERVKRDWSARFVYAGADGRLIYDRTERGDRVPDFSHCGFAGGGVAIPDVPAVRTVQPSGGDDGPHIQAAIDALGTLPVAAGGFRGAVLLSPGTFYIATSLVIRQDGIVLRGTGSASDSEDRRTTLVATGLDRRSLIRLEGAGSPITSDGESVTIADEYVPCGTAQITVERENAFALGDLVCVEHSGSAEWIAKLGMNRFPARDVGSWLDWRPNTINIRWLRTVSQVAGKKITLDVPLTSGLDASLTKALVRRCDASRQMRNVGVENLICVSRVTGENPMDEDHAWNGVSLEHVQDAWVRGIAFRGFCGSAVLVHSDCRRITVSDCVSAAPVSELAGWRRQTFLTNGQQTLFLRCRAEDGRHDFAVGHAAAGPNAFSYCDALRATEFSGPIGSWASGVLYDNVTIDGAPLALTNRETAAQGTGWSAANCLLWNCVAPSIACRMPPTAQNWAIGVWGEFTGDGHWRQPNEFVEPDSLLAAQLADRLPLTADQTQRVAASGGIAPDDGPSDRARGAESSPNKLLTLTNGRLLIDGQLAVGKRLGTQWWRGSALPDRAHEFASGVTRFVPGHDGRGFTDDLDQLTDGMRRNGAIALEHHWGLWYDRRRDDHQVVRRMDGAVWAPFYEQPWARSGVGTAWDGLSKYDLTRFNPWYFARLREFAGHCDRKGLILIQHMYFQHNLLEAGAHWADFPWRPANCLQDTGFPEPPPLVNRKRVLLANEFWDVTHPVRRDLHERYIRHCLDQLGEFHNVIFTTGEEFTGPSPFVAFWIDTIAAWQREHTRDVLVALSCTKDVQDETLANPSLAVVVDVIDLKYWWYTSDGGIFAPAGGCNLAPRQQLREHLGSRSHSASSIAKAVEEYRHKFAEKAVICSFSDAFAQEVLSVGGSLPEL